MSGHLGADLAALVDGELDHAARERVLRHLSSCAACRTEVEAQRRFKARLRGLDAPDADSGLSARLRALSAAGDPCSAAASGATTTRRPRVALGRRRRSRGPRGRSAVRRTAMGGAALAIGLGAVFVLGAPHSPPTRTPVDPTSDVFLIDYAGVAGELPLPEPAGVSGPSR